MKLEDLLLKKEELPISFETSFHIPIHPKLVDGSIRIDKDLPAKVFPQAAQEWYEDLKEYAKTVEDPEQKKWIEDVFLSEKPVITKEHSAQRMRSWTDHAEFQENGFAYVLSISRNTGGTLYYNPTISRQREFIVIKGDRFIRFGLEKIKEFATKIEGDMAEVIVYNQHNVEHHPGALFLRNWALLYMNEVFKQVFPKVH